MRASQATRRIDGRGARTGAAVSVVLLIGAILLAAGGATGVSILVVAVVAVAMAVSAATALRVNALATPFRVLRRRGVIGEPGPEDLLPAAGLRLAQTLGAAVLGLSVALAAAGFVGPAVLLVGLLVSLQALLAVTGICVACHFYGVIAWMERRRQPVPVEAVVVPRIHIQR